MQLVVTTRILEQESVSLVTTKTIASPVILLSGLEQESLVTMVHVEIETPKPWDIF